MALEFHILTGARAGQRQTFDKSVIALGRHPLSDLRFDAQKDLDVSTKHAEIHGLDGKYILHDLNSTNGTFVNGSRIGYDYMVRDGDRISLGEKGPQVEVHLVAAPVPETNVRPSSAAPGRAPLQSEPLRRSTTERVAIAVAEQTSKMRSLLVGAIVILGAGVGVAYWLGHRESQGHIKQLEGLLAQNDSATSAMNTRLLSLADTSFVNALKRQNDQLRRRLAQNHNASPVAFDSMTIAVNAQHAVLSMDIPSINDRNAAAVAYLVSELDGKSYGATAFGITKDGLLVTNRHNVRSESTGSNATRIVVKFNNTPIFLSAHTVKISADSNADLAIVQVDAPGAYPVVAGVAGTGGETREGSSLVSIGFPLSTNLPMSGDTARTTLTAGIVTKRLTDQLQIDTYAAHGSSGSPVFDAQGYVVGVIWGGPQEAQGKLAYAVPSRALAALLPPHAKGIIK